MVRVRQIILAGALLVQAAAASQAGAQAAAAPAAVPSAAASAPAYAGLPLQRDGGPAGPLGMSWGLQLVVGAALVAVLAGAYRLRRRHVAATQTGAALQLQQSLRLTQGASLHVVQWGDGQMLLACTATGVTVVSQRPAAARTAGTGADIRGDAA